MDAVRIASLIDALKKEEKTSDDVERIYETLSKLTFFNKFITDKLKETNREAFKYICYVMKHEKYKAGSFVFKQGDPSNNKFYVVLSGKVAIILKENMTKMYQAKDATSHTPEKSILDRTLTSRHSILPLMITQNGMEGMVSSKLSTTLGTTHIISKFAHKAHHNKSSKKLAKNTKNPNVNQDEEALLDDDEHINEEINRIIEKNGYKVRELILGEAFGEKALENNENRSASILCIKDCDLLVLEKNAYNSIFGKIKKEKVDFLSKILPFENAVSSSRTMEFLIQEFKDIVLTKGDVLTSEMEPLDKDPKIYFIQNGECIIEKKYIPPDKIKQNLGIKSCWIKICNVGKDNMIGEEVLDDNKNHYDFRVTVISKRLTALVVGKKELKVHFPKEFIAQMEKSYEIKKEAREDIYHKSINETLCNQKNLVFLTPISSPKIKLVQKAAKINFIGSVDSLNQLKSKTEIDTPRDNSNNYNNNHNTGKIESHPETNETKNNLIFIEHSPRNDYCDEKLESSNHHQQQQHENKNQSKNRYRNTIRSGLLSESSASLDPIKIVLQKQKKLLKPGLIGDTNIDEINNYKFDFGKGIKTERAVTPIKGLPTQRSLSSNKTSFQVADIYMEKLIEHKERQSSINERIIINSPFYTTATGNSPLFSSKSENKIPQIIKGSNIIKKSTLSSSSTEYTLTSDNFGLNSRKTERKIIFPSIDNQNNNLMHRHNISKNSDDLAEITTTTTTKNKLFQEKVHPRKFSETDGLSKASWVETTIDFYSNLAKKSHIQQILSKKTKFSESIKQAH